MGVTMYKTIQAIPLHCFSDKEATKTPSKELRQYLRFMLDNHPLDLEYLWRHTQQYTQYGGCYSMTFVHWRNKLDKELKKESN